MSVEVENRCFIGGLSFQTTDRELKDAFKKFGHLLDAKVSVDKFSGRPRGFGFITFEEKRDMDEAIEAMNGVELDGRNITVEKAQAPGSGRDRGGSDHPRDRDRDYGRDRDRGRDYGGGRGSGGGDCFSCGKTGHFARECPDGRQGGREDRYGGGGGREDRYGRGGGERRSGPDRGGDRYNGRSSRDSDHDGGDRYGGGRSSRDSDRDGGGDRYGRDRSAPYDRKSSGGYRS